MRDLIRALVVFVLFALFFVHYLMYGGSCGFVGIVLYLVQ
jgi:hypothetical protein